MAFKITNPYPKKSSKKKSAAKMLHSPGKEHTRKLFKEGNPKGMMLQKN